MNFILAITCTFWILNLNVIVNAGNYRALLFTRDSREVVSIPNNDKIEGNCGAWAIACPAVEAENEEKKFIEEHAITKTALSVKKMYNPENQIKEMEQYICETPFQMTVLYNLSDFSIEFGYEVFYKVEDKREYRHWVVYENYCTIEQWFEANKYREENHILHGSYRLTLDEALKGKFGAPKYPDASWKMNFFWVPIFRLKFSGVHLTLACLKYEMRRNQSWPVTNPCEDYNLGLKAYERLSNGVDQLYTNQEEIFKNFELPSKFCTSDEQSCKVIQTCASTNACLEKWSLIPLDQYHIFPTSPLHCSYMVTVPVWTDVSKAVLEKIDQYLYVLFRILGTPLQIITGVKPDLKLPRKNNPLLKEIVYLDPTNKKIAVPKIIFKLVKYKVPGCDPVVDKRFCEYSAIIFVHNDPNFTSKDKLCTNTKKNGTDTKDASNAEKWGWDAIEKGSDGNVYENVYVCPKNQATLNKIDARYFKESFTMIGDLDLSKLPVVKDNEISDEKNIVAEVDAKFEELLAKGDMDIEDDILNEKSQSKLDDENVLAENLENRDASNES